MAKKTIINAEFEQAVQEMEIQGGTTTEAEILQVALETHPNISIRKLALAADVTYGRLLKASKEPIEGVAYDPTATNYVAMAKVLGKDKILDLGPIWDELNQDDNTKVSLVKDMSAFQVGGIVHMRKDKEAPFKIIHITQTHIVVQRVDQETPYAWSHNTFLLYGPSLTPRTSTAKVDQDDESQTVSE